MTHKKKDKNKKGEQNPEKEKGTDDPELLETFLLYPEQNETVL